MNFLIVTGNNGQLKILSFNGNSIDITMGQNDLNGNLFQVQSEKGTAVILSEDGILYLLEENFEDWHLNEEVTIKEAFFTNVFQLDISKYLLMDIEGKLNLLYIDRMNAPKDLWDLPLYQ